jgi:hypothetical protein
MISVARWGQLDDGALSARAETPSSQKMNGLSEARQLVVLPEGPCGRLALQGVRAVPARRRCATLPWEALRAAPGGAE